MSRRKQRSQRKSTSNRLRRRANLRETASLQLRFETLESRQLLASDVLPTESLLSAFYSDESPQNEWKALGSAGDDTLAGYRSWSPSVSGEQAAVVGRSASSNVVIIDASVANYQSLLTNLAGAEVIVLDPDGDGIEQISEALKGYDQLAAVHLVSHGSSGSLQLGSTQLMADNLEVYSEQLRGWNASLSDGADILLYGCNVAEGRLGLDFVEDLAALTGADIAASDDLTGSAAQGGDWQFEAHVGSIESSCRSFLANAPCCYCQLALSICGPEAN